MTSVRRINISYEPLRLRFPENKWMPRVAEFCRTVADRYVLRFGLSEDAAIDILGFLSREVLELISLHSSSSITFEADPAGGAGYTQCFSIDEAAICCDLAASAYERFVLHRESPPVQGQKLIYSDP